jgi:transcriptional regulator with XRE-family HTH domain
MQHVVQDILETSGVSISSLATRSGVARSSQYRILDGSMDPTAGTLRELALAAGLDLRIDLAPLSDPDAARAARVMLDSHFAIPLTKEIDGWVRRLKRWVPDDEPIEIARTAGLSSSLLKRSGATFLNGSVSELKLASAGEFTKQRWLLSGVPVIDRIAADSNMVDDGIFVAYSADARRFVRLLDHVEVVRPEKANLVVVPYTDDLEQDAWHDGSIQLVAPIQGLIDAFGLGGQLAEAAERIAQGW